jgi:hypothetical protein
MSTAAYDVCEGCGVPLTEAEAASPDVPRLCTACIDFVKPAPGRRRPRLHHRQLQALRKRGALEERRVTEPRGCPYCFRSFAAGFDLVQHLGAVHHATITLVRCGETWPTPHNDG